MNRLRRARSFIAIFTLIILATIAAPALADCVVTPNGSGNDYICSDDSDLVDATPGNDLIINNGTIITYVWGGSYTYNASQVDTITNNGVIGDGTTDDGMWGGSGNDIITNNGTVYGGDYGAIFGDGSDGLIDDDTIINNGTVYGSVYGDYLAGGDDTITINGLVDGDVWGEGMGSIIAGNAGNDLVILTNNAVVTGEINGNNGTDTLRFDFSTADEAVYNALFDLINAADPASGSLTFNSNTFDWLNFEVLENSIVLTVAATIAINAVESGGTLISENGATDSYTLVLASPPSGSVFVLVTPDAQCSVNGSTTPITLTFNRTGGSLWSSPQTVTVAAIDDMVIEDSHTCTISHSATGAAEYSGVSIANVTATITDNDSAGVTVSAISGDTSENLDTATFTIVLDGQPTSDVTIGLSSDNTNEGTVLPISVTFTNGNWNVAQTVTVTGVDDALVDGNIAYNIVTGAAVSSDTNYNGIDPANVAVTNVDNDVAGTAGVTVSAISGDTSENLDTATFTIVLNTQPTADVTIGVSSDNTNEGTVLPVSVTFTNGDWNIAQTVTVTGVDDALVDGNIAYNILTAAAVSGDANYNGIDPANVAVTNVDNDAAGITVSAISGDTSENLATATFTIVLETQPTSDVTIALSSDNTNEGTVLPISVTFTNGDWNIAQTVTVTGVDDALVDGNIAYNILTAAGVSGDTNYNGIDPANVAVTNVDNDVAGTAGITVSAISGDTSENGNDATFTIVLDTQPTNDVTIGLSSDNTNEGTVLPVSVTFTNGDWNIAQTVTVTGVDDALVDGNIAYNILTAAAVSGDSNYSGFDPANVAVTNVDNDVAGTAGITVSAISGDTSENLNTATFTIVLDTQPTNDVTIGLSSDNTNEGTVLPVSVTFTNGDWNIAQTVTVTGVDDALVDGNIAYNILTAAAVSSDTNYNGIDPANVAVTNIDNDVAGTAGITVSAISGDTSENLNTATFTIVLDTQPTADVTIGLSSDNTNEGNVLPVSVTFTNGNWNIAQTVTVTGVDDAVVDGNIVYNIVTAAAVSSDTNYNGIDPANVAVTNVDNDTVSPGTPAIIAAPTALHLEKAGDTGTYSIRLDLMPSSGSVTVEVNFDDQSLRLNGVSVSPLTLVFTDLTPQTVTVEALLNGLPRKRINHTITASDAPEYIGLSINHVTVHMAAPPEAAELPPPPPAKLCFDMTFEIEGALRSYIPLDRFDVNCRVLVENGNYLTWLGGTLTHSGQIGDQSVLDEGVVQAVDVFSPSGKTRFEGDVVICLRGSGSMIYLNVNQAPRVAQEMTTWQTSAFPGFNCVTLYEPGTVVMVQSGSAAQSAAAPSAPAITELAECHVTTTDALRLRTEPNANSEILATLPPEFRQRATAFVPGWYRVSHDHLVGWVSAAYVRTEGTCAG